MIVAITLLSFACGAAIGIAIMHLTRKPAPHPPRRLPIHTKRRAF
jgi:hypothetical protein